MREPRLRSLRPVKLRAGLPKRAHARFTFAAPLDVRDLPEAGQPRLSRALLHGKTENISTGGLCIRAKQPLRRSQLVRCELCLPGVPTSIPFLAQVRWSEKRSGANPYRVGLQFVV